MQQELFSQYANDHLCNLKGCSRQTAVILHRHGTSGRWPPAPCSCKHSLWNKGKQNQSGKWYCPTCTSDWLSLLLNGWGDILRHLLCSEWPKKAPPLRHSHSTWRHFSTIIQSSSPLRPAVHSNYSAKSGQPKYLPHSLLCLSYASRVTKGAENTLTYFCYY